MCSIWVNSRVLAAILLPVTGLWAAAPVVESVSDYTQSAPVQTQQMQQSMQDMLLRLQALEQQLLQQNGQIEELNYHLMQLQQDQKERYIDLDRRMTLLQKKESIHTQSAVTPEVNDDQALQRYNQAKELVRVAAQSQDKPAAYRRAIEAFTQFINDFPNSALIANAYFWQGELYYFLRDFQQAQQQFTQIIERYPQHEKAIDALYKLGQTFEQLKDNSRARAQYTRLLNEYPSTQQADLARSRLQQLSE